MHKYISILLISLFCVSAFITPLAAYEPQVGEEFKVILKVVIYTRDGERVNEILTNNIRFLRQCLEVHPKRTPIINGLGHTIYIPYSNIKAVIERRIHTQ